MTIRKSAFLITIDTEGDDVWSGPREISTENANYLSRFQELCEKWQLRPTYLTNYEMATSNEYVEFAKDMIQRDAGEVGMHLHAWNSPPIVPLTADDYHYRPYLIEFPDNLIRKKIAFMTRLLEDTFEQNIISHRAGRWSFDEAYACALVDEGYLVDCSVTPFVSWRYTTGDPRQVGGTDYLEFANDPYFVDLQNIRQPGDSNLLELPMTIRPILPEYMVRLIMPKLIRSLGPVGRIVQRLFRPHWLRPNGRNLKVLLEILNWAVARDKSYVEFMLHSSELMPGGSPTFKTKEQIEVLYEHLEILFAQALNQFRGATLAEYHARVLSSKRIP